MEKKSVELHRYLSLIMLMLLIIRKVSGGSFYFVIDGSKKIKVPCYGCPAGREPHHKCGHTYTKQENDKMDKECRFCKLGFYKKLSLGEYSSDKCIACAQCFGYKVIRECHPMYGRECSFSECEVDRYMSGTGCHKCCHCPADGIKEIGCKNSPSKKFCRADASGTCRQLAHTPTAKVNVLTNTTKPVSVSSSKVSRLTKTTKPVNVFSSSATSEVATSTKLSSTTNQKRVTATKSPAPVTIGKETVSSLKSKTRKGVSPKTNEKSIASTLNARSPFSYNATFRSSMPKISPSSTESYVQVSKNTQSYVPPEGLSTSEVGMSVGIPLGVCLVVLIIILWAVVKKKCCVRERKEDNGDIPMRRLLTRTEILEQEKCIECKADAKMRIWGIEQSDQKFENIWQETPPGDICEIVYKRIVDFNGINAGVSNPKDLQMKLRAEEPDLKVASLLYVLYHLKQKAAVKKMHIVLHG